MVVEFRNKKKIMRYSIVLIGVISFVSLAFVCQDNKTEKTLPTPENVVIQTDNKQSNTIEWNVNRKLTWNDFQGVPVENDHYKARTFSTVKYSGQLGEDNIEIIVTCKFNKKLSWSKSKKRNSQWLLEHEQLHFDIAELIARRVRKEYKDHISYEIKETNEVLRNIYNKYIDTVWTSVNEKYDTETNHGIIRDKQNYWEEKIARELKELEVYGNNRVVIRREKYSVPQDLK